MKKQVKLNEAQLRNMVTGCIKKALKEFISPVQPATDYEGNDLNYEHLFDEALKVIDEMNDGVTEIRWQDVAQRMGYHLDTLNEDDMELLHDAIESAMAVPGIEEEEPIQVNETKIVKIVAESVKRVLNEINANTNNRTLSIEEIHNLVSILKQNPITDMWKPYDCGFCMVQRVEANQMVGGRCFLISQNEDGSENLYQEEKNGYVLINIGRMPNTYWYEESGSTYMAWKEN